MLLKPLLTTLGLGMASVATAQTSQPNYYDHDETNTSVGPRAWFARGQFVLANNVTLSADRQASFVRIDPRLSVSRLRLDLKAGRAYVTSVFVMHADGRKETVPVGQMLSPAMPRLVINLPGRDITGVAINSTQMRSARGGGYRRMQAATVNVIGLRR